MGVEAGVKQKGRPVLERLFLPPHHQLTDTCGGAPVHLAQVVAVAVLAGRDVIVARGRDRPGRAVAAPDPVPSKPDARQRGDDRGDDQVVDAREGPGQLAEAKRVGEADRQRADTVTAANVGPDGVADLAHAARLDPVEDKPGPPPQGVGQRVLHEQDPAGQARDVVQPQPRRRGPARLHPRRVEVARAGKPVAGPGDDGDGAKRQGDQEDRRSHQVALPEGDRAQHQGEAGSQQAPSAGGQAGQGGPQAAHRRRVPVDLAEGSGTRATSSATTSSVVRRET